jgi:hypothetical protein
MFGAGGQGFGAGVSPNGGIVEASFFEAKVDVGLGVSAGFWLERQRFAGRELFAGDDLGAGGAEEEVAGAEEAVVVGRLRAGLEPRGFLLFNGHNDHSTQRRKRKERGGGAGENRIASRLQPHFTMANPLPAGSITPASVSIPGPFSGPYPLRLRHHFPPERSPTLSLHRSAPQ